MPVRVLIMILAIVLLGACGDDDVGSDPDPTSTLPDGEVGDGPYPVADLAVHYTNRDVDLDMSYRISCQGDTAAVTGDDVAIVDRDACAALADDAVRQRLVDGPPDDQVCTEIYGGADSAEITGTIDDQPVDTQVHRKNGCAIDDWDNLLRDILPAPVGATPGPPLTRGDTTSSSPPVKGSAEAIDAVDAYIATVASGDLEGAWDLVAEPSRDALGRFEEFEALRSALSEGIGAWDNAENRKTFTIPIDGAEDVWAVTLLGVVPLEGPPALAATSMIVYTGTSPVGVSSFENAFGGGGFLSFDPPESSKIDADTRIRIGNPGTTRIVAAYVDGMPVDLEADPGTKTGQLVITDGPLAAGPHALTVVAEGPDGARTAIAAAYEVE